MPPPNRKQRQVDASLTNARAALDVQRARKRLMEMAQLKDGKLDNLEEGLERAGKIWELLFKGVFIQGEMHVLIELMPTKDKEYDSAWGYLLDGHLMRLHPTIEDGLRLVEIVCHEAIHAVVGIEEGYEKGHQHGPIYMEWVKKVKEILPGIDPMRDIKK